MTSKVGNRSNSMLYAVGPMACRSGICCQADLQEGGSRKFDTLAVVILGLDGIEVYIEKHGGPSTWFYVGTSRYYHADVFRIF